MNTPDHYDPEGLIPIPTQRRSGPWSKLGGGALTFAILIHVIVLTIRRCAGADTAWPQPAACPVAFPMSGGLPWGNPIRGFHP
jgi:hypothetical protein